jgi:hypothetical protein
MAGYEPPGRVFHETVCLLGHAISDWEISRDINAFACRPVGLLKKAGKMMEKEPEGHAPAGKRANGTSVPLFLLAGLCFFSRLSGHGDHLLFCRSGLACHRAHAAGLPSVIVIFVAQRDVVVIVVYTGVIVEVIVVPSFSPVFPCSFLHFIHP